VLLASVGLTLAQAALPAGLRPPTAPGAFPCAICMLDFPAFSMLSLPCGHFFCVDCWRDYNVESRSKALVRLCPDDSGCQCRLLVSDVRLLLGDAAAAGFEELIAQCHIERSDSDAGRDRPLLGRALPLRAADLLALPRCRAKDWNGGGHSLRRIRCRRSRARGATVGLRKTAAAIT
jgi:hypothetical protein